MNQNGLVGERLREVLRAVAQDHRLARPGHAVNHPMALPHAPGELLLLEIHLTLPRSVPANALREMFASKG